MEIDWLKHATQFDMGMCEFHNRPLMIERRLQIQGNAKWVVKMHE